MFKLTLPLAAAMCVLAVSASAGDAAKGEKTFRKCKACHQVGEDAKNRVGPQLTGVIGRTAGTAEGYKYGADMIAAGEAGLVWTEENMAEYLIDPSAYLKTFLDNPAAKAKMRFKLGKEEDRKDVAAYLATFSE